MLTFLLALAGALAVLASSVWSGHKAHLWARRRAPQLAAYFPIDSGAWIGLTLGALAVWRLITIP